jgi:hypothetical protein
LREREESFLELRFEREREESFFELRFERERERERERNFFAIEICERERERVGRGGKGLELGGGFRFLCVLKKDLQLCQGF